jgi:hypothetical protein
MSVADADVGVLARGAALSLLRTRLAECGANLQRIYHDTKNAPQTLINLANDVQTSSLSLKLVEYHAQIATRPGDILDNFVEQWQSHVADIERLCDNISRISQEASLPGSLYAAEQQQGLGKLIDRLDHAHCALKAGVQLYHQEEQNRKWLERQNHSASSIVRPDHGHSYSGIELREHARAHFGDAIYYNGNVYITHCGTASEQTVAASKSSTRHGHLLVENEDESAENNEQIAAMRKTMQTHNAHVTSQLSLIVQQTRLLQSHTSGSRPTRSFGPEPPEESFELVHGQAKNSCSRRTDTVAFRVKLRLPMLFSSRAWDIARVNAYQGWDLRFRTYNRLPKDAMIFKYCEEGDFESVKRMIHNGEASLYDVDEDGNNLLSVSIKAHKTMDYTKPQVRWYRSNVVRHPSILSNGSYNRTCGSTGSRYTGDWCFG